jgi:hypothetical protein
MNDQTASNRNSIMYSLSIILDSLQFLANKDGLRIRASSRLSATMILDGLQMGHASWSIRGAIRTPTQPKEL